LDPKLDVKLDTNLDAILQRWCPPKSAENGEILQEGLGQILRVKDGLSVWLLCAVLCVV
jgi:hypothetical protein